MADGALCAIEGCGKAARKRGWCDAHYRRWLYHGDPLKGASSARSPDRPACSIEGCDKPVRSHGWCAMHHMRWLKYRDPLYRAAPASGEVQRYFRDVVLPYDGDECLIWPFAKSERGYGIMDVPVGSRVVSRIMCQHHHGPPPTTSHEAAHSCGRGHEGCVAGTHVSWKTHRENEADKLDHGTHQFGEQNPSNRISEAEARAILAAGVGETHQKIADRFGVARQTVGDIKSGRRWGWLQRGLIE